MNAGKCKLSDGTFRRIVVTDQKTTDKIRRRTVSKWLQSPLSKEAAQSRNWLLTICALAVGYVRLGITPKSILGVDIPPEAASHLSGIFGLLLLYFWYLFTAQASQYFVCNFVRPYQVEPRYGFNRADQWPALLSVGTFWFRFGMEILLPNAIALYVLSLVHLPTLSF
jgi:hypothetical protein